MKWLKGLNYDSSRKILNNRIEKIITKSKVNYSFDIQIIHVKILFSLVFGLISGIFICSIERNSYFDNFYCNVSNFSQISLSHSSQSFNSENQEKGELKLEYISKIKSILNSIIIILFLNPLLDNFIGMLNINTYIKKLIIIFFALTIEFMLGFYVLWYTYFMFSVQNYQDIIKFVKIQIVNY